MNSIWPSRASSDAPEPGTGLPVDDVADTGVTDVDPEAPAPPRPSQDAPARPPLLRNQASQPPPAVPPPPVQAAAPPPPPPGGNGGLQQPQDSLSLAQLRRIVAEFPRAEPVAYDFDYADMGPFDEEVDEWFVYQFWQWARLNSAQKTFERQWEQEMGADTLWEDAEPEVREDFVGRALETLSAPESKDRADAIEIISYVVLGRWGDTAGGSAAGAKRDDKTKSVATAEQLEAVKAGVQLLAQLGGVRVVWDALRDAFEPFWGDEVHQMMPGAVQDAQDELVNLMTIMYMMIQQTISSPLDMAPVHTKLLALDPALLDFMMNTTARLRWDEAGYIPHGQVFLLFWKSLLLVFGGSEELAETKKATSETATDDKEKEVIMASPLDYHTFRQEITSKYPAYTPPQPQIPLEAELTSLLPPLPNHPARNNRSNDIFPAPPNAQAGGASILHQPVHIATPAPSPPPSPGVGGKGGKKQNYQTNQNFPFMYPPLDATSNSAGGKGAAGMQYALVGRKWEGSDVPASILEAGDIFSKRVRTSRALRQLWDERERFLKYERGWNDADEDLIDDLDLSSLSLSEKEELGLVKAEANCRTGGYPEPELEVDYGPRPDVSERAKQRLDALESFYGEALPQLQSLVIVLLKVILMNVAILMVQVPPNQQHPGMAGPNGARMNGPTGPARGVEGANGADAAGNGEGMEPSAEEVDAARSREINSKAVSAIILLLLKWFKISHVLKFEYLSQLLLDCNWVPLLLKLWAHQDIQQLVDSKTDRTENSFFYFCNIRAGAPEREEPEPEPDSESEDDAAPPPIKRRRSPSQPAAQEGETSEAESAAGPAAPMRPEVDEMGYPVNPLPQEPITDFSRRNFFTLINQLRIMQKVCKNKAHRNLILVNYKSSTILRKMLKIPQQELRLYTLKLFKNQVPYCGRKWRQGNMRVITAVYLHCRPELRDEWLAGADVDAAVEESLPLEQALRSLTHWFNVRRYPDKTAAEVRAALREEQDFFVRELDKLDLHWAVDGADGDSVGGEWEGMG